MKHGHGNDGLAMPASVAHPGMDLFDFDRRHEWEEERGDGHHHFAADEGAYSIAMGEAHGANILSATLTSALTVENQVSFVLGMAL
ncbi:MAG TPA: hypothetical protein VG224_26715 [Reyranella sp.]|jgi:hypothetical protein|nr:hypothetical protein [Reyranella sp.]